jgi:hypothetical protein
MMDVITHAGPFSVITGADGSSVPLYLIPFDKEGRCIGPNTLKELQADAARGLFTDIHVYSHGWNNTFKEAIEHYVEFFTEYFELRKKAGLSGVHYKPLIAGVIWPSAALLAPDEEAPAFAGDAPLSMRAAAMDEEMFAVTELAAALPDGDVQRFLELSGRNEPLNRQEALELARILLPVFGREAADQEGIAQAVTPEKLVKAWEQVAYAAAGPDRGKPGVLPDEDEPEPARDAARAAGFLDLFNPKDIIRMATVFLMKDRAGTVGAHGVGPMLQSLLATSGSARVHLTGHSFGAKVLLSALSLIEHPRKVTSVLLLQPAINMFCFAQSIQENRGRPGAYRPALDKTEVPILSTFSSKDAPLTGFFHLALRRDGDLGEIRPATTGAPSIFAALGGYGAAGLAPGESKTIPMPAPPRKYDFSDPEVRLYEADGSDHRIMSHGDVRNEFTEWALVNLVSGRELP